MNKIIQKVNVKHAGKTLWFVLLVEKTRKDIVLNRVHRWNDIRNDMLVRGQGNMINQPISWIKQKVYNYESIDSGTRIREGI